ncbi:hypothetical protein F511_45780 [Dorcoceras hygrometricum]|uniref:Uncharacterized protein n=1 Tax=Dorcoceras hygrometricum TaxID=472368 RepID=A0A2Z6ZV41_9LAMI|nr:hypothetical protein F511_45780 [Dorcoceras hygrometricum]
MKTSIASSRATGEAAPPGQRATSSATSRPSWHKEAAHYHSTIAGRSCAMREVVHAHAAMASSGAPPPMAAAGGQFQTFDFQSEKLRMFSVLPRWHLCLAPTGVSRTRLFSVDCGRYANTAGRNSGEVGGGGGQRRAAHGGGVFEVEEATDYA